MPPPDLPLALSQDLMDVQNQRDELDIANVLAAQSRLGGAGASDPIANATQIPASVQQLPASLQGIRVPGAAAPGLSRPEPAATVTGARPTLQQQFGRIRSGQAQHAVTQGVAAAPRVRVSVPQPAAQPAAPAQPPSALAQFAQARAALAGPRRRGGPAVRQTRRSERETLLLSPEQQAELSAAQQQAGQAEEQLTGARVSAVEAEAQLEQATADVLQRHQDLQQSRLREDEERRAESLAAMRQFNERQEAALREQTEQGVDPRRMFRGNTGRQIMAAIGSALGALGAGLTRGPNFAQQIIDSAIDRDVAAQRAEMDKGFKALAAGRSLYADMLNLHGNEEAASAAAAEAQGQWVQTNLARLGSMAGTAEARARIEAIQAGLAQSQAQRRAAAIEALGTRVTESREETARSGGGGGRRVSDATIVQLMKLDREGGVTEDRSIPGLRQIEGTSAPSETMQRQAVELAGNHFSAENLIDELDRTFAQIGVANRIGDVARVDRLSDEVNRLREVARLQFQAAAVKGAASEQEFEAIGQIIPNLRDPRSVVTGQNAIRNLRSTLRRSTEGQLRARRYQFDAREQREEGLSTLRQEGAPAPAAARRRAPGTGLNVENIE